MKIISIKVQKEARRKEIGYDFKFNPFIALLHYLKGK